MQPILVNSNTISSRTLLLYLYGTKWADKSQLKYISITVYSARVGIVYFTTYTLIKVQLSLRFSLGARTKLLDKPPP